MANPVINDEVVHDLLAWDGQMTDKVDGLPQVQCHAGHQWGTEIEVG